MLTGVHFLLSYRCIYECDHCFLYSSPRAQGTFTLAQVEQVLKQAADLGTVSWVYFEGGEPALFYPLLIESVRLAGRMGFEVGVVTNAYFATSEADAALWLGPLRDLHISDLSISDDDFHSSAETTPGKIALSAAQKLGLPVGSICIDRPRVERPASDSVKGKPVVGGGVRFRGRAVETLTKDLPTRPWSEFNECPHEELAAPERVHVDAYGNVQVCQGLSAGNLWVTPLRDLMSRYRADRHPICGPLVRGGPAALATELGVPHADGYVDACHFCYSVRRALIDRFPEDLAPRQVYGLDEAV